MTEPDDHDFAEEHPVTDRDSAAPPADVPVGGLGGRSGTSGHPQGGSDAIRPAYGSRVLVCGGRTYADREFVFEVLDALKPDVICHGNAPGADTLADKWSEETDTEVHVYSADWRQHGKAAGPIRNQLMLDQFKPDLVVAFPGGRGTEDMCRRAAAAGVVVDRWSR